MSSFENWAAFCLSICAISLAIIALIMISIRGVLIDAANQIITGLRAINDKLDNTQQKDE